VPPIGQHRQPLLHRRGARRDPRARRSGVLFAHGSRFGGHTLYVKDNLLHYAYNFVSIVEQKIVATKDLPTGENLILSTNFEKDGDDPPGVATWTLALYHGEDKVGEGRIKTQPGKFQIGGERLCAGRDSGEPVTEDYPGAHPYAFTGGTINRVAIDVSGEPYVDLEREAAAMPGRRDNQPTPFDAGIQCRRVPEPGADCVGRLLRATQQRSPFWSARMLGNDCECVDSVAAEYRTDAKCRRLAATRAFPRIRGMKMLLGGSVRLRP
jgi:hypothetical protein